MRRRQVRNGLRIILISIILIMLVSFFNSDIVRLLSLPIHWQHRFYSEGIFWSAAVGGYGVIVTVLGLLISSDSRDRGIRLLPVITMLLLSVALFFYLLISSFNSTVIEQHKPGTSISIT
jgi:hypothetical protein